MLSTALGLGEIKIQAVEQPPNVEMYVDDDLFVKQIVLARAGYVAPQHSHEYDHATLLAAGSIMSVVDTVRTLHTAPSILTIKAGTKHLFMALTDNCVLYCIHNLHGEGYPAIREQFDLESG